MHREGVLAGYVNGTASLGRWNVVAGLRVENTNLRPHSFINPNKSKNQNYTDFFPTLRVVYFLNQEKGNMLNASYTRRISRPGFNQLNPFRIQLNNYSYIVGNPDMKPSYSDSYTLTGVIANKYSLTLGFNDQKDAVTQVVIPDPDDPGILLYQHRNVDRMKMYYAMVNVPVQVVPWWRVNVSALVGRNENELRGYENNATMYQAQWQNLFTLPRNWSFEANYSYTSGIVQGNMKIDKPLTDLSLSVKKSFFDNKLTASVYVDNVLDNNSWLMRATVSEPGQFTKQLHMRNSGYPTRRYGVSLRWNFRAGKDTRQVQKVTAGNEEERARE